MKYEEAPRVTYFDLFEYIKKIKIDDNTLRHLEETGRDFEEYLEKLRKTVGKNNNLLLYFWLDNGLNELIDSNTIENKKIYFTNKELLEGNIFFESFNLTEKRIKDIHRYICDFSKEDIVNPGEYRKKPAWVGEYDRDGNPDVIWFGAESKDIEMFMKSLIQFCNKKGLSTIYHNPFVKTALIHLFFVKIHPFSDCNGRTARVLHNLMFTDMINDSYGTKLKLSPMTISKSIYTNKITYVKRIDAITFNLEDDNNEAINKWINFILDMYDEQIYYNTNRLSSLEYIVENENELLRGVDESVPYTRQLKNGGLNRIK